MSEFKEFGKIARYNRDVVITEKLDGTNAAIIIEEFPFGHHSGAPSETNSLVFKGSDKDDMPTHEYRVTAQSRNRLLTPGKTTDNFGFAAWVEQNKCALVDLGPGYHYGEWYGQGIQRTYGLTEKRFALFNVLRWQEDEQQSLIFKSVKERVPQLELVPLRYRGPRLDAGGSDIATREINILKAFGSSAVPGFMQPEGVVVMHTASRQLYKVTCEKDETYKGPEKKEEHQ